MTPRMRMKMPTTNRWKEKLERILKSSQDRDPGELITDIRNLGAAMGHYAGEALLDANPEFLEYRPAIKRAFYEMIANNEISQTRKFLRRDRDNPTSFTGFANTHSLRVYNRSADMYDHLDFRGCRRIVMVGCGWMPSILFHVHDKTDIPELVGLDINPSAIATSNELAKRLGYARVRTELQNGLSYDYSKTQIVYIVGMVSEMKSAVVSRIADTAPRNVQVLVNEPYSLGRLWHEAVEDVLDHRFEVIGRGPDQYAGRSPITEKGPAASLQRDVYLKRRSEIFSPAGQNG